MRFMFSKEEEEDEESVKIVFRTIFLHAVTFRRDLHLDVISGHETECENFLIYGYNAGPPIANPSTT